MLFDPPKNTFQRIYNVVYEIPKGKVLTYGQVATLAGNCHWARIVGYALHANPMPGKIPCHRVVTKDGEVSSAFAFGGSNEQIRLLQNEGIIFNSENKVDLKKYGLLLNLK